MNEEELIVHVQSYPFLYDLTDARYSNTLIRETAWEEIGHKMKHKVAQKTFPLTYENICKISFYLV
ncbi:unnamed protein product [Callosobruchus maculatus]|uniref:MADF domain-containing protein n=1 Tax=Callosobruchus maculatus TaxID=64391 RepID=A0A653DJZ9_CALMS|nr:unnamed protein product [Callosobruchus maculatus]VEN57990.1 unnamed protein product [Callosobruchus maculatus]VEN60177.1 unnamed protein product [Callosobruchus maculatus]